MTYNTNIGKLQGGSIRDNMSANKFYSLENNYKEMTDEKLIEVIKSGDKNALEYLIHRYKELVNIKVSKYYIVGAEKDDIIQEGLIGLFKAIKCFKPDKHNSFKTFANMCVERQLITAIKTSNRQKHVPLNSYLSLNMSAYDDDDDNNSTSLIDVFDAMLIEDPLETITKKEYYANVESTIDKTLSDFERQVLTRYMNGESYIEIAQKLDTPVKSVDNAIQRIRKKATKGLTEE